MQTHSLGNAQDLLDEGHMKLFEIGDKSIVLAKRDGEYYAFDSTCTHYGGPLQNGVLHGHTVMCPWHHACFDVRTGALQEPPALDAIASYPVHIVDGEVSVELDPIARPAPEPIAEGKSFVIVGGGAAGEAAAEALRSQGFAGTLILLSAADKVPIDRPNVSKHYLAGDADAEWMPLRSREWYARQEIDLQLNTRVTRIDTTTHTLVTDKGATLYYDNLLLASGSDPLMLDNLPGATLENIFTLRTQSDADHIIAQTLENSRVVVVGASFIGMEVAASLGKRGADITIVALEEVPFAPLLGEAVGRFWQDVHEEHGIKFQLDSSVKQFHGADGRVTGVEISDGTKLPADLVIVGIGAAPSTAYLSGSGIALDEEDQSVIVDHHLQTSVPDVYAAGDIARFPLDQDRQIRIEHWRVAQQHGFIAAHNMLGRPDDVRTHVPFFWTAQWGTRLRYVGFAGGWDEIVFRGDPQDGEFIAFYLRDGKLLAAAGVSQDVEMSALEFILKHDLPLSPDDMRNPEFDLVARARST
ncbi:MAG: FAD-dependent oxidoreductase [Chloroflexi bacterium]|nr:FAD-dependent oxidoreductase [Chloroflexota bacterium]